MPGRGPIARLGGAPADRGAVSPQRAGVVVAAADSLRTARPSGGSAWPRAVQEKRLPQQTGEASARSAQAWSHPTLIAVNVSPSGGAATDREQTGLPSVRRAQNPKAPLLMALNCCSPSSSAPSSST